jgi:hypothetical protein
MALPSMANFTMKELFFPEDTAVCIPPGAPLPHDVPAPLQKYLGGGAEQEVTFLQTSAISVFK